MITNKHKLNELFYKWLAPTPREPIKNRISVTAFDKPLREFLLERKHWDKIEKDAVDFYLAVFGQALHSALEHIAIPGIETELKMVLELDEFTLVGKLDLVQDKMIKDHKSTSMKKLKSLADKKKWQQQTSIYRWMYFKKFGVKLKDYAIINILLRDWDQKIYPSPIHEIRIHLWSLERTEIFVTSKLNEMRQYNNGDLPECTGDENWYGRRCTYCSIKKFCGNWTEVK